MKMTPFIKNDSLIFPDLTDTCGTGGDESGSFNISSMAALVAAACGLPVAKHGNRAVSSKSGSADFYEALGIPIDLSPHDARVMLEKTGFVFLFAPKYHAAMSYAGPAGNALGIKTIMNLIGPLANPAQAQCQVIGVYDAALLEVIAKAAILLGVQHVLVVHSQDGLDEISPFTPTDMVEMDQNGMAHRFVFEPQTNWLRANSRVNSKEEIAGASAKENARLAEELIAGKGSKGLKVAVALNAGAALYVAKRTSSIEEGATMAMHALEDGLVAEKLDMLRAFCVKEDIVA